MLLRSHHDGVLCVIALRRALCCPRLDDRSRLRSPAWLRGLPARLSQVGAVGRVDLSDSPALEQQLQLATLTQHAQLAELAQRVQHAQQAQKQALQGMPWALPSAPPPAQHEAHERPSLQLAVLLAQSAACMARPGNLLPQPSGC